MTADYGLPPEALQAICRVLAAHPAVEAAILYGSRALGRQRPGSDIDLTLQGERLQHHDLLNIALELDDLLLPWKIDLSLLAHIDNPACWSISGGWGGGFMGGLQTPACRPDGLNSYL